MGGLFLFGRGVLGVVVGLVALGVAEGLVTLEATSLVVFVSFLAISGCSTSLEGLPEERKALAKLSLPISTSSKTVSTLDPEELDARMAGG